MIEFENVSFTYEGAESPSLRDCSLHVKKGEFLLLCGESGCGKTTVIKLINGLLQHTGAGALSGCVRIAGNDTASLPMWELARQVGSVFQNPKSQFFNLDTTSEVLFGLENLGTSRAEMEVRLRETADACGVNPLLGRSIFALSGGEKQRIAVASACALGPEIFVLDEPSSNLDDEGMEELRTLLTRLKEQGKTIVMAEHRLWYAAGLADRVLYIRGGTVEKEYTGAEFLAIGEAERRAMGLRALTKPSVSHSPSAEPTNGNGLEVENLSCAYGRKTVWTDISFSVPAGRVTAVLGPNGAGKTTLARCLCGLMRPQKGRIWMNGKALSPRQRRRKGFLVMQDVNHQLFANNVQAEAMLGNDATEDEARQVLLGMGMDTLLERHPMSLSGGEKQRLAVADALLCGKDLLLFDEPTSGLDYRHMCKVGKLLNELAQAGKCVLVITHDAEFLHESDANIVRWH